MPGIVASFVSGFFSRAVISDSNLTPPSLSGSAVGKLGVLSADKHSASPFI